MRFPNVNITYNKNIIYTDKYYCISLKNLTDNTSNSEDFLILKRDDVITILIENLKVFEELKEKFKVKFPNVEFTKVPNTLDEYQIFLNNHIREPLDY